MNCRFYQGIIFGCYFCKKWGKITPELCDFCPEKTGKSKYNNKKTEVDNIKFDSKKESQRYMELSMLQKAGVIKNLERQVPYILIPKQLTKDGKVLYRECRYVADFEYIDCKTGQKIVEDVKGLVLPEFKLKQKMMMFFYGIEMKVIK